MRKLVKEREMKMRKTWKNVLALVMAITMLATILCSCGGSGTGASPSPSSSALPATSSPEKTYTVKIGGQWADASIHSRIWTEKFIPDLEGKSGGRFVCEFYGNNQTGNELDQLTQLQMGELQLGTFSDQAASLDRGMLLLPFLPFLFEKEEQWDATMDGEIGQQLFANLPASGIRCVGVTENGYRQCTNNIRPINSASDMVDMKMRVTSSDMYIALFTALGCSCQAMTLGEAYSALETGACDGQDNAYNTILSAKLYEVQKYLSNTNHVLGSLYNFVNESWYQSLPEDLRAIFDECMADAIAWQREEYRAAAESDLQALVDAGMQVNDVSDPQSFIDATSSVYDNFYAKYPGTEEIVAAIRALA